MTKAHLRQAFLTKRMLLNEAEQQMQAEKITTLFSKFNFGKAASVLSYMALATKKEVNPTGIEKVIIAYHSPCCLCYPKIDAANNSMEAIEFTRGNRISNNQWGIAEIKDGNTINPQQIDIVLTPLLCFDKRGYRVGYGKGFYDRYIARCRPDVLTIGLSFFEPVDNIEDVDEYDMPMKYCITPEYLYQF